MNDTVPTTPGIYMAIDYPTPRYDPYKLTKDGDWFEMNQEGWYPVTRIEDFVPLVPLLPDPTPLNSEAQP